MEVAVFHLRRVILRRLCAVSALLTEGTFILLIASEVFVNIMQEKMIWRVQMGQQEKNIFLF